MALRNEITNLLAEIIRDRLSEDESVTIGGLGTFRLEHEPYSETTHPDGSVKMNPPKNHIRFEAETE